MAHGNRRVTSIPEQDAARAREAHELTAQAQRLLNEPVPDTFLGRKTQEPSPEFGKTSQRGDSTDDGT